MIRHWTWTKSKKWFEEGSSKYCRYVHHRYRTYLFSRMPFCYSNSSFLWYTRSRTCSSICCMVNCVDAAFVEFVLLRSYRKKRNSIPRGKLHHNRTCRLFICIDVLINYSCRSPAKCIWSFKNSDVCCIRLRMLNYFQDVRKNCGFFDQTCLYILPCSFPYRTFTILSGIIFCYTGKHISSALFHDGKQESLCIAFIPHGAVSFLRLKF